MPSTRHQNRLDKPLVVGGGGGGGGGGGRREGRGNCLKYLKRGWNRKDGGETKILKVGQVA